MCCSCHCFVSEAGDIFLNDPNVDLNGGDSIALLSVRVDNTALELGDTLQLVLVPSRQPATNEILLDTLDVTILDADGMKYVLCMVNKALHET